MQWTLYSAEVQEPRYLNMSARRRQFRRDEEDGEAEEKSNLIDDSEEPMPAEGGGRRSAGGGAKASDRGDYGDEATTARRRVFGRGRRDTEKDRASVEDGEETMERDDRVSGGFSGGTGRDIDGDADEIGGTDGVEKTEGGM